MNLILKEERKRKGKKKHKQVEQQNLNPVGGGAQPVCVCTCVCARVCARMRRERSPNPFLMRGNLLLLLPLPLLPPPCRLYHISIKAHSTPPQLTLTPPQPTTINSHFLLFFFNPRIIQNSAREEKMEGNKEGRKKGWGAVAKGWGGSRTAKRH